MALRASSRYYDPGTASFLTRDPLNAVTRSAYGYVGNSPLNRTDPSGMIWPFDGNDGTPVSGLCVNNPLDPGDGCDSVAQGAVEGHNWSMCASVGVLVGRGYCWNMNGFNNAGGTGIWQAGFFAGASFNIDGRPVAPDDDSCDLDFYAGGGGGKVARLSRGLWRRVGLAAVK